MVCTSFKNRSQRCRLLTSAQLPGINKPSCLRPSDSDLLDTWRDELFGEVFALETRFQFFNQHAS